MKFEGFFIDLDGTIIRNKTVCQVIAQEIGRSRRMKELELNHSSNNLIENRLEIINWYKGYSLNQLTKSLDKAIIGSGVIEFCNC